MRSISLLALITLAVGSVACRPSEAETVDRVAMEAAEDDQNPRLRRVWSAAGDYATPSPDGRLVAFVDWSTGDVAVHDLSTGESRRITDKGSWTDNGSWAEWPIFSPDGKKVVYSYGNVLTGDPFRYELRYVELGDTTQHLLRAIGEEEDWIAPLDWSERGIAFTHFTTPDESRLGILDPETGDAMILEADFGKGRGPGVEARFSPDGRQLAYWMQGLKVRDLEAGTMSPVDFSSTSLIDWTADGRALVVHSVHEGRAGLWAIPLNGGRSAGEPRLLREGIPSVIQGGGRAGEAFYYSIPADAPRVHVASIDVTQRRMLSAPAAITTAMDGAALLPVWSAAGTQLAYLLRPLNNQGPTRLMVRQADREELRELATLRLGGITSMAWSRDDSEILLVDRTSRSLHAVSVRDGSIRTLLEDVGDAAAISPDGHTAIAVIEARSGRTAEAAIIAVDLRTNERRTLERLDGRPARGIAFAPDGERVVYVTRDQPRGATEVRVLPVNGGASRSIARADYPRHFEIGQAPLAWMPDGRQVLVTGGEWGINDSHDLWAIPLDGGEAHPLGIPNFPGGNPYYSLHPGGNRLAYVMGEIRRELWVLDRIGA